MTEEPREHELDGEAGEVLPSREMMSVIGTDPADALLPPGGEFSIQPIQEPGDERGTLPVEPPAA